MYISNVLDIVLVYVGMPSVLAEFLLLTRNKTTNFKESLISSLALIHNYINNSYFVYYREEANVIYIIYKKTVMMRVDPRKTTPQPTRFNTNKYISSFPLINNDKRTRNMKQKSRDRKDVTYVS